MHLDYIASHIQATISSIGILEIQRSSLLVSPVFVALKSAHYVLDTFSWSHVADIIYTPAFLIWNPLLLHSSYKNAAFL